MKFLVLGAGAIGGYFGGRLAESGADVTFLVRPARRGQLERDGLCIESALGNMSRPVQTALADSVTPDYDVVLLTCKAYDLQSSIEAIAPAVGPQTAIIPLLNGLAHFAVLDARFGASRVMGGTCMIDSTLGRDGVVHHGGTLQRLVFGERDGRRSPRAEAVAAVLAGTTLDWSLSDDIEQITVGQAGVSRCAGLDDMSVPRQRARNHQRARRSRGNGAGACRQRRDCGARRAPAERFRAGLRQNPTDRSGRPVERLYAARPRERWTHRGRSHRRLDA